MKNALKKMILPNELKDLLARIDNIIIPTSRQHILDLAMGDPTNDYFETYYNIPGVGKIVECTIAKCKNGLAVNYTDPYMRRRDPDTMVIADDLPTDKITYKEKYGKEFDELRSETLEWFTSLDGVVVMPFMSGGNKFGYPSLLICPANAAFFAGALADIQSFIPFDEIKDGFKPMAVMYVAPPFRMTHFNNKQIVIQNRKEDFHEVFSYNLYLGPSAKKGVYSILLALGERDETPWATLHTSSVKVTTPYENVYTIMHEGASGGGKSEMLEQIHRDQDGKILLGTSIVTGEEEYVEIGENSKLMPVTDDMALSPPQLQTGDKVTITDAESGWFLRVDHIQEYGTEYQLEKMTINPKEPLIFLNIDASPKSTALIWEHVMDTPTKRCPNPRVVIPRSHFNTMPDDVISIDLRSFGLRTPPTTKDNPGYAVVGLFHVIPPAIAWLWRLVAPRGFANPSISDTSAGSMGSEGVGSYWPFATGKMVTQANILLRQIVDSPGTKYVLIPNQHIGSYRVGFMGEWISREYLARRGHAKFRKSELEDVGTPLLGYNMKRVRIDGKEIPREFLKVYKQPDVGMDAFNEGSKMLENFFKEELQHYLTDDLDPLGREIIEAFLNGASLEDLEKILPCAFIID